jgi:hypothetical protein
MTRFVDLKLTTSPFVSYPNSSSSSLYRSLINDRPPPAPRSQREGTADTGALAGGGRGTNFSKRAFIQKCTGCAKNIETHKVTPVLSAPRVQQSYSVQ